MLDIIMKTINRIHDSDWSWYPFLKLKPQEDELITTKHAVRYTAQYGLLYFVLLFVMVAYFYSTERNFFGIEDFWIAILYVFVFFLTFVFLAYKFIIAPSWNYRARKLRKVSK